ncbi:Hypothetical protein PHPALM_20784 [Phytophthora palmivora]|uniref:Nucleotide-diphospho-sugar transferase n=1 Tax=Phytophthora palmivora TaxID=4796 RepID=A0A2P4XDZ7_9STRA|nr:Hypothetical protein PHPALM_20784 [Phytophthora palmivora]
MARTFGSLRLRWIVALLGAGVIFVLSDVLWTWRQLTTSVSSSPPSSTRGSSRTASPATMQAIYDAVAKANDSADVQALTQFVDRLSESQAAELLHKINLKATTAPATVSLPPAIKLEDKDTVEDDKEDDTLRMETEELKAGEVEAMKEEERLKTLETQLLHSLHNLTQRTMEPRGVVVPLYDDLVPLGLSLIMELRSLGVTLPVEIPHCGDLDQKLVKTIEKKTKQLGQVVVYNACELAAKEKSLLDPNKPIFCNDLNECHDKFRTFDIKVLGVLYSRFEEVMVVDADALMMQNPMSLWETEKFQKTGTLFFNDRISQTNTSLGYRPASRLQFTDAEVQQIYQRQHFFDISKEWEDDAKEPLGAQREAAEILTNEKLEVLLDRMKNGPPLEDATDPPKDPFKEEELKKATDLKIKADELREQEKQLVHTLNQIAQQTTVKRGIVIPVYDGIIKLAISLVLELRTMGIKEPIEMPHCGDLNPDAQKMYLTKQQLGTVWFYNVCEKAARTTSVMDSSRK